MYFWKFKSYAGFTTKKVSVVLTILYTFSFICARSGLLLFVCFTGLFLGSLPQSTLYKPLGCCFVNFWSLSQVLYVFGSIHVTPNSVLQNFFNELLIKTQLHFDICDEVDKFAKLNKKISKLYRYFMFFTCTYETKQSYTKSCNQISLIVAVPISNSGNSILEFDWHKS